jgi:hypothetical protein
MDADIIRLFIIKGGQAHGGTEDLPEKDGGTTGAIGRQDCGIEGQGS